MKIKVLGTGCAKCKLLYAEAQKAVAAAGIGVELEKVEKIDDIMKYGVMVTPAAFEYRGTPSSTARGTAYQFPFPA